MKLRHLFLLFALSAHVLACSGGEEAAVVGGEPAAPDAASDTASELQPIAAVPPALVAEMLEPFHGDFAAMVENRRVRVLVTYNKTNFFLDGGTQRGITADALREFEAALNKELKLGTRPLRVMAIPVARDQLIPFLEEGRGDIAAASLTITTERAEEVDFSLPAFDNVSEIVVTGSSSPAISTVDDLAGKKVFVRPSSSYHESLEKLNATFRERGLEEIIIAPVSEYLETEDLLEMVNAGLIGITVADDYLAEFWAQVLPNIVVHSDIAVGIGQKIGWAIRRDATGLKAQVDQFIKANRAGKLLGNMLVKRYLQNTKFVKNALADKEREKFNATVDLFRKYSDQYGFDHLLLMAQGYQESRLDQGMRSPVGAIGIMQLMPTTAADKSVGIPDISTADNNVHAGARYLRHLREVYFNDPELDEMNAMLFCFAAYNAGPNRICRLRNKTRDLGLDANRWFGNVEQIVADEVGREPVRYVRNIVKYYTAYKLAEAERLKRESMKSELSDSG